MGCNGYVNPAVLEQTFRLRCEPSLVLEAKESGLHHPPQVDLIDMNRIRMEYKLGYESDMNSHVGFNSGKIKGGCNDTRKAP